MSINQVQLLFRRVEKARIHKKLARGYPETEQAQEKTDHQVQE